MRVLTYNTCSPECSALPPRCVHTVSSTTPTGPPRRHRKVKPAALPAALRSGRRQTEILGCLEYRRSPWFFTPRLIPSYCVLIVGGMSRPLLKFGGGSLTTRPDDP